VIRLVAVDVDGTLVAPDGRGVAESRAAFAALAAADVAIAIATGRMVQSAAAILQEAGVERGYVIALNGSELWAYPLAAEPLWRKSVPAAAAARALEICLAFGAEVQGYVAGELRILRRTARTEAYARRTGVAAHLVAPAELTREPQKLLALLEPAATGELMTALRSELCGQLDCFRSEPDFVEIVPAGVDKGVALAALAERLGLPRAQVAAAGDGENDVAMLRSAGRAFAPRTAADAVLALGPRLLPPPPDLVAQLARDVLS